MAYVSSSGQIVPPPGTTARGRARANEVNDVHLPYMMQHMMKPPPDSIVNQDEVKRLSSEFKRYALRSRCSKKKDRQKMIGAMVQLYNISPEDAIRLGEECKDLKRCLLDQVRVHARNRNGH